MLSGTTQFVGMIQNLIAPKKGDSLAKPTDASPNSAVLGDRFTLSPDGQKTLQFLDSENAGNHDSEMDLSGIYDMKQRGEMLSQMLQMKMQNFQGDFLNQMKTSGIDASLPIDLEKGADGNLQVSGDHPEKGVIDQFLAGDEKLSQKFDEISDLSGLLKIVQSVSGEMNTNPFSSFAAYAKQSQPVESNKTVGNSEFKIRIDDFGL